LSGLLRRTGPAPPTDPPLHVNALVPVLVKLLPAATPAALMNALVEPCPELEADSSPPLSASIRPWFVNVPEKEICWPAVCAEIVPWLTTAPTPPAAAARANGDTRADRQRLRRAGQGAQQARLRTAGTRLVEDDLTFAGEGRPIASVAGTASSTSAA
jgi:hypothetical protein